MEDDGRGVDDGDVDRAQARSSARTRVAGVAGDEVGRRGGGGEAVVEHGAEELRIGLGDHRGVPDDALGESGVLLQADAMGVEARDLGEHGRARPRHLALLLFCDESALHFRQVFSPNLGPLAVEAQLSRPGSPLGEPGLDTRDSGPRHPRLWASTP